MISVTSFKKVPEPTIGAGWAKKVNEATVELLSCGNDVGKMKRMVDELYQIFKNITNIDIANQNSPDIYLPTGKAISPERAAHCLLEMKRTTIFLRGIYKAIHFCINEGYPAPINILYAGTGPYATLLVPLLTLFSPGQVVVDLVEVNETSLNSVLKVFESLGLMGFVERIYPTDAATLKLDKKYDIVVAEVMQAALKKEPQVAVMHNLVEQLGTSVVFIPQEVELTASVVTGNEPSEKNNWATYRKTIGLGNLFTLDKYTTQLGLLKAKLPLPQNLKENNQLYIHTTIRVFEEERLEEGDCSLTLPLKVGKFKPLNSTDIYFWYEQGTVPGIRCKLSGQGYLLEALGGRDPITNHFQIK